MRKPKLSSYQRKLYYVVEYGDQYIEVRFHRHRQWLQGFFEYPETINYSKYLGKVNDPNKNLKQITYL